MKNDYYWTTACCPACIEKIQEGHFACSHPAGKWCELYKQGLAELVYVNNTWYVYRKDAPGILIDFLHE